MEELTSCVVVSLTLYFMSNAFAQATELQGFGYNAYGVPHETVQKTLLFPEAGTVAGPLTTFTNCLWVHDIYDRSTSTYVHFARKRKDGDFQYYKLSRSESSLKLKYFGVKGVLPPGPSFSLRRWHHLCVVVEEPDETGLTSVRLYLDGKMVVSEAEVLDYDDKIGLFDDATEYALILGQEQDEINAMFEDEESLYGFIYDFRIWNATLDEETIRREAKCVADIREDGNLVRLAANINESNHDVVPVLHHELCKRIVGYRPIIFPRIMKFGKAVAACDALTGGGGLALPASAAENEALASMSLSYADACPVGKRPFFIGATRDPESLLWWGNLTYTAWAEGEPDPDDDCAAIANGRDRYAQWSGVPCWRPCCPMCRIDEGRRVLLKGACADSSYDTAYTVANVGGSVPAFRGLRKGSVTRRERDKTWVLVAADLDEHNRPEVVAALLHNRTLPVGRHVWQMVDPACDLPFPTPLELSLSFCHNETEFSCSDGSCVDLAGRCNLVKDCIDGSDEMNCSRIGFADTYNKQLPPKIAGSDQPLVIDTSLRIRLFNDISTLREELEITFDLEMQWRDSQLDFFNLRDNLHLNRVPEADVDRLWLPKIGLSNAKIGSKVAEKSSRFVACSKKGEGRPTGLEFSKENLVFGGRDNDIVYREHVKAKFPCKFDLAIFPFDSQTCCLNLKLTSAPTELAILNPVEFVYAGPERLKEFYILHEDLDVSNVTGEDGGADNFHVATCFALVRMSSYQIMTTFSQSLILGCISYSTLYIRLDDLRVRFTGALTAMLVLVSLLNTAVESLPPSANVKFIDLWFISLILTCSLIVIVHIVVDRLLLRPAQGETGKVWPAAKSAKVKKGYSARSVNRAAQLSVPAFFVTFNCLALVCML